MNLYLLWIFNNWHPPVGKFKFLIEKFNWYYYIFCLMEKFDWKLSWLLELFFYHHMLRHDLDVLLRKFKTFLTGFVKRWLVECTSLKIFFKLNFCKNVPNVLQLRIKSLDKNRMYRGWKFHFFQLGNFISNETNRFWTCFSFVQIVK